MNLLQGNRVSSEGRLSQQGYVLCFALPFLATLGLTASMFTMPDLLAAVGVAGPYGLAFGWLLVMALGDALNIKRYHDLGHSGRLYRLCRPGVVVLPLLAFALDFFIPAQMATTGDVEMQLYMISEAISPTMHPVTIALLGLTAVGVTGNVLYLSLMPGQQGPNSHGPDPRGDASMPGMTGGVANANAGNDDPVERALADYHARLAQTEKPATMSVINGAAPAGAFGKKRR